MYRIYNYQPPANYPMNMGYPFPPYMLPQAYNIHQAGTDLYSPQQGIQNPYSVKQGTPKPFGAQQGDTDSNSASEGPSKPYSSQQGVSNFMMPPVMPPFGMPANFQPSGRPQSQSSWIEAFKTEKGHYDVNKIMTTAGQMMSTAQQFGSLVKGIGSIFPKV
ncbi:YppG family protein [Jeotgalibacillus soli]|uniref:Spore coat protein n=1 Tax=Jeotgalibacillus soli TaxID=889306 RepID=A0A0C2VJI9_9BACL|nr:YppG family protein [Jeotgalibacillus soli]KIL44163.1 hypothetical protein KP78_31270 [Jeotgalibacillus soli]